VPEDGLQICFIALVTGLVTVAGSVGYHWFSVVYQFLGFLCLEEHSLKLLEPKLKISCQDASYGFNCTMSVFLTFSSPILSLFLNHSETILNHPQPSSTM